MSKRSEKQLVIKTSRVVLMLYAVPAVIGLLTLPLTLFLPDPLIAFLLMGLPGGLLSCYLVTRIRRLLKTRIVIDEHYLLFNIPDWADGFMFAGQESRLNWDEIHGVTHERCDYGYEGAGGMPVDEYTIHSARGRYTLTKSICPRPERVARLIAERAGCEYTEVGEAGQPTWKNSPAKDKKKVLLFVAAVVALAFVPTVLIGYLAADFAQKVNPVLSALGLLSLILGTFISAVSLVRHYLRMSKRRVQDTTPTKPAAASNGQPPQP